MAISIDGTAQEITATSAVSFGLAPSIPITGDLTLSDDQASNLVLEFTGSTAATVKFPAKAGARWILNNGCSVTLTLKTVASGSSGKPLRPGAVATMYCDGTNLHLTDFEAPVSANEVLAGPGIGASAPPDFRALVAADVPSLDASKIGTGQLALARGGTGADLSGTGGIGRFLKQSGAGADVTVSLITAAEVPDIAGDVTGPFTGVTVEKINGNSVPAGAAKGDIIFCSAASVLSFLNGNTTANKQFLTQTGTGSASTAPTWATIAAADLGSGAADSTKYLRGDQTWAVFPSLGSQAGAQSANFFFAGPGSGSAATPIFRSVVGADLGTGVADNTTFLRGDLVWTSPPGGSPTGSAGGDLSGTYPDPKVAAIQGHSFKNAVPTDGQVPIWVNVNSDWEPTAVFGDATLAGTGALTLTSIGSAATKGDASHSASVSIDAKGRVTSLSDGLIAIDASQTTSGSFSTARLGSGTASSSNFLRGDGSWAGLPNLGTQAGSQTANTVFAGPTSGAAATPAFRPLVAADIPSLNASKINAGQLAVAQGGTGADLSGTGGTGEFLKQSGVGANVTVAAIAASDVPNIAGDVTGPYTGVTVGKIQGIATSAPTAGGQDLVYDGSAISGKLRSTIFPARVASAANLNATYANGSSGVGATLTNAGTMSAISVDGVSLSSGDAVLVKNQTTGAQNGVYTVTTVGDGTHNWVLTREYDFNSAANIVCSRTLMIQEGATNSGTMWVLTTATSGGITIGTTTLSFGQLMTAGIPGATGTNELLYDSGSGVWSKTGGVTFTATGAIALAPSSASQRPLVVSLPASFNTDQLLIQDSANSPTLRSNLDNVGDHVFYVLNGSVSGNGNFARLRLGAVGFKTSITSLGDIQLGNYQAGSWTNAVQLNAVTAENHDSTHGGADFIISTAALGATSTTQRFAVTANGNVVTNHNQAALSTSAVDGALFIPSMAGFATGSLTSFVGNVGIVADTTNNLVLGRFGSSWLPLRAQNRATSSSSTTVAAGVTVQEFSGASGTITLPSSPYTGQELKIIWTTTGTITGLTVAANGTAIAFPVVGNIGSSSTCSSTTKFASLTLYYNGSQWYVTGHEGTWVTP